MSRKVSIIGAGNTGTTTALLLAQKGLSDIVLLEVPELASQAKGKALDLLHSTAIFNSSIRIVGTEQYEDTSNSDIVVITAGVARKPGMSRNDLLDVNLGIMHTVVKNIIKYSQNPILLILTNPVDAMTYAAYKFSGLERNKIIGQGNLLDTARYRAFVAEELKVGVSDVSGLIIGIHGEEMVPLTRYTFVKGIPLAEMLTPEKKADIIERTRRGGQEIVELLKSGSSYFAPAASLVEMIESILLDKKHIVPAAVYLDGEYGYSELVIGVPVILGAGGIDKIVELTLLTEERAALNRSAAVIKNTIQSISSKIESMRCSNGKG